MIAKAERRAGSDIVHVLDDRVEPALVALAHRWLDALPYARDDYDHDGVAHIRHYTHRWSRADFAAHPAGAPILAAVEDAVAAAYPGRALTLARIHANAIAHGDHASPHIDSAEGVTAIYYANPEWDPEWHGETIFYDDAGEAAIAVSPRGGRLAIFPGGRRHRVGDPSRLCFAARLTIAFKFDPAGDKP